MPAPVFSLHGRARLPIFLILILLTPLVLASDARAAPASEEGVVCKVTLMKIDFAWFKVSLSVPSCLVASRHYELKLTVKLIEVDGELEKFYIKGVRVTLGSERLEYVPDSPASLKNVGDEVTFKIKLEPRFFAANMYPGDIKSLELKVDFAYFIQGKDLRGVEIINSGLYTAFASIPVRVVAPKVFVHVQPELEEVYEPAYLVVFKVKVWVTGEGYIENARVLITGAPVQCNVLATGRLEAGEQAVLSTLINVTGLGPLARDRYSVGIQVSAITPWGFVYRYSYSLQLHLLRVRKLQGQLPSKTIAGAFVPIDISLHPSPASKEKVTIEVYCDGRCIYRGVYPLAFAPLALSPGRHEIKIVTRSGVQAPATLRAVVEAVKVTPRLEAALIGRRLDIRVFPLCVGSQVSVQVKSKDGRVVFTQSVAGSAMSMSPMVIQGMEAAAGATSIMLPELPAGAYSVVITYNSPLGSASRTLSYTVKPSARLPLPLPPFLRRLPTPVALGLILIVVLIPVLIVVSVTSKRRRKSR